MSYKVIDLSLDLYNGAPTFNMDPKFNITQHSTVDTLGYNISRVTMSTHQGTHLDAPRHFFYEGRTVDKIRANRFTAKAFKVDLSHKKPKEPILPEDLKAYDDRIIKGATILLETGWNAVFPKPEYFSDFPYVTVELTDYLCEREINLLGLDIPTPNPTDWVIVHQKLLKKEIIVVESLTNLKEITADEFLFVGLPLKFKGADGSPVRAIAIEGVKL
jgi:arylformamidase